MRCKDALDIKQADKMICRYIYDICEKNLRAERKLDLVHILNWKIAQLKSEGVDTPEKRQMISKKESLMFEKNIFIPEAIKGNVIEGFEPLMVSAEIIETNITTIINMILDFDESTSEVSFMKSMKDTMTSFVGELIDELKDGFTSEMTDVVIFFRENIKKGIEKG